MEYANRCQVPYVVFVGENEIASQTLTVKNMATGTQITVTPDQLLQEILHA